MTNFISKLFFIFIVTSSLACTHLVSVSTTSVPAKKGKRVTASSERMIFLLLNFDNNYVDYLVTDLASQCPNGKVKGILTKHESTVFFPLIAHKITVTAEGYCVSRKS